MDLVTCYGHSNKHTIPFLSYTIDPKDEKKTKLTSPGEIVFKETLISYEGWNWIILELDKIRISFQGKDVVNFPPETEEGNSTYLNNPFLHSTSSTSYHRLREWVHEMITWGCQSLILDNYPNCVFFDSKGQIPQEPAEDMMQKAHWIFSQKDDRKIVTEAKIEVKTQTPEEAIKQASSVKPSPEEEKKIAEMMKQMTTQGPNPMLNGNSGKPQPGKPQPVKPNNKTKK